LFSPTHPARPPPPLSKLVAPTPAAQILELGAGCGTLGLTLARNLPAVGEVCLTEQAYGGALNHLRINVAANAAAGMPGIAAVTTAACDWTEVMGCLLADAGAAAGPASSGDGGGGAEERPSSRGKGSGGMEECPSSSGDGTTDSDTARLMSTRWDFVIGSDLVGPAFTKECFSLRYSWARSALTKQLGAARVWRNGLERPHCSPGLPPTHTGVQ
jgi:hypothetical protein